MYCVRLFIVVLQELHCLLQCLLLLIVVCLLKSMCSYTKFRLDWLLCECVTWPSMPLS